MDDEDARADGAATRTTTSSASRRHARRSRAGARIQRSSPERRSVLLAPRAAFRRRPAAERSPAGALARLRGPARPVERVERRHLGSRQREVEDVAVLLDPLAVRRLRQHDQPPLDRPPDQHLRRRAAVALGDLGLAPVAQVPARAERAVRLERDAARLASLEEPAAELERAELDLVDDRLRAAKGEHLVDLRDAEVRDADRLCAPGGVRALHALPRPRGAALGPVDDVQVDLLDAQALEAALRLLLGVPGRARIELRRDEDLVARHAAVANGAADARLVPVGLRRVDVAVAELERPADRVLALGTVRDLPDAQAEERDLVAVGEDAGAPVGRHCP